MAVANRVGTRAAIALSLAAALLALPAWSSAAPAPSCCGVDCTPCPLSFCKTTRADRALVPPIAAIAPTTTPSGLALPLDSRADPWCARSASAHAPRAFHPLRN